MVVSEKPSRKPGPKSMLDSLSAARARVPAPVSAAVKPAASVSSDGDEKSALEAGAALRAERVRVWHVRVQLVWASVCAVVSLVWFAVAEGMQVLFAIFVLPPVWAGGALVILLVRWIVVPLGHPIRFWWLGASGLGIVVGSLVTWEKTEYVGVLLHTSHASSGLDRLGWLTLVAGIGASAAAVWFARANERRRPSWPLAVCAIAAVLTAGVVIYEWLEIGSNSAEASERYEVSRGWGLYLTGLAAVSLLTAAAACFGTARQAHARRTTIRNTAVAP